MRGIKFATALLALALSTAVLAGGVSGDQHQCSDGTNLCNDTTNTTNNSNTTNTTNNTDNHSLNNTATGGNAAGGGGGAGGNGGAGGAGGSASNGGNTLSGGNNLATGGTAINGPNTAITGPSNSTAHVGNVGNDSGNSANTNTLGQQQGQGQSQTARGGNATGGNAAGGAGGSGSAVAIVSTGPSTSSSVTGPSQSYSQGGGATVGNLSTGASTSTSGSSVGNLSTGASTSAVNGSGNGGVSTVSVGGDTYQAQARNPVNTAYAPTVITGSDQCLVTVAVGAQGVMFGVTFGTAKRDENCELMKLADRLKFLGRSDVAIKLLSQDERVAKALKEANDERAPVTAHREPLHTADLGRQFDGRTLECSGAGCADR